MCSELLLHLCIGWWISFVAVFVEPASPIIRMLVSYVFYRAVVPFVIVSWLSVC